MQAFKLQPSLLAKVLFFVTGDRINAILRDQPILSREGRVVWGCLVQANSALFDPRNLGALPANAIYSPDLAFDNGLAALKKVAEGLYDLKGQSWADPEINRFADLITSEMSRALRLPLPPAICHGREAYFSTCLIDPKHLPGGCLAGGYFPLVICPEKTEAVMILPARYWPVELCQVWMRGE